MSTVKYEVRLPDVPGADLLYPNPRVAEREAANARRLGQRAEVVEVLVRR